MYSIILRYWKSQCYIQYITNYLTALTQHYSLHLQALVYLEFFTIINTLFKSVFLIRVNGHLLSQ